MLVLPELAQCGGIRHGFFTRDGGVSEGVYASLNCGFGSGDQAAAVAENRRRAMQSLELPESALVGVHQIHSADVVTVETPWPRHAAPRADAMVTRRPGICLGILTADCVPILFAEPEARVIGAAHAGWKGARGGVAEATVAAMVRLGALPSRIRAGIGPAIRQPSYEVGAEFPGHFPGGEAFFRAAPRAGHFLFDLPGYVASRLSCLGLAAIADLGLDTAADEKRFFSYRRTCQRGEPDYGRALSAIALAP
jgi:YfiH family protein